MIGAQYTPTPYLQMCNSAITTSACERGRISLRLLPADDMHSLGAMRLQ